MVGLLTLLAQLVRIVLKFLLLPFGILIPVVINFENVVLSSHPFLMKLKVITIGKLKKKKSLSYHGVHLTSLTQLLNQSWIFRLSFKTFRELIESLCDGLDKYRTYLKKQSNEWKIYQGSLTPCRSISESIQLQHLPVTELYKPQYSKLQQLLLGKGFYDPIFLNEYAPEDHYARKNWFCGLELGVPTMLYRFMHGNNLGTLNFLWKDDDFEKVMARLKNVKAVRSRLESSPEVKQKVNDSLQPVISLLNDRFNRMKLKGRHFKTVEAAGENQIESIFGRVQTIDASVSQK